MARLHLGTPINLGRLTGLFPDADPWASRSGPVEGVVEQSSGEHTGQPQEIEAVERPGDWPLERQTRRGRAMS
jgi:hypothetical protein